jgi:hypothetical protein
MARVVAQQALDAQRHVLQPSGCVEPWRDREADVGGGQGRQRPPGHFGQRRETGTPPARAQPPQAGRDQRPVAAIERHQVGDRADGNQVQQAARSGSPPPP